MAVTKERCTLTVSDDQIAMFTMHDGTRYAVDSWLHQMEDWAVDAPEDLPLRILVDYSQPRSVPMTHIASALPRWVRQNEDPQNPRQVYVAVIYRRNPLFAMARNFVNGMQFKQKIRFFYDDQIEQAKAWLRQAST